MSVQAVNLVSFAFVQRLFPETKGTTLEQLEERLETLGTHAPGKIH